MNSYKTWFAAGLVGMGIVASPAFGELDADVQRYNQLVVEMKSLPKGFSTEYCLIAKEAAEVLNKVSATGDWIRFGSNDGGREHRRMQGVWEKDTRACISKGYLPDSKASQSASANSESNDVQGFVDTLNDGLGLNIDLNSALTSTSNKPKPTISDYREYCSKKWGYGFVYGGMSNGRPVNPSCDNGRGGGISISEQDVQNWLN